MHTCRAREVMCHAQGGRARPLHGATDLGLLHRLTRLILLLKSRLLLASHKRSFATCYSSTHADTNPSLH